MEKIIEKIVNRCAKTTLPIIIVYAFFAIYLQNGYFEFSIILLSLFIVPYNIFVILFLILEKKHLILNILIFFVNIVFFIIMKQNFSDFSNCENWQYYNRQSIISDGIDFFIGKHLLELYFLSIIILIAYTFSFIVLLYEKIWKK
ncbi:hypothetical protein [Bergeyella zoohelcum]|uniref:Uncharacterized protein n=1 Tax=Bergeyella zoohelcum TaxID=1015 RepID=A0A7Z8YNM6_9FLAO|nr:hypothetical protein [Bergeyella zoohelcum]VDH02629.1 Uncharacterised protein [Bergeyella zoohelcum]